MGSRPGRTILSVAMLLGAAACFRQGQVLGGVALTVAAFLAGTCRAVWRVPLAAVAVAAFLLLPPVIVVIAVSSVVVLAPAWYLQTNGYG